MKKFILLIFSISVSLTINAQSSIMITNDSDGSVLSNSTIIYSATTIGGVADHVYFTAKNISTGSKNYHVRRTDLTLHKISSSDSAVAYFCFGTTCFPATTTITPSPRTIASNVTESLKTYIEEATTQGYSSVKYEIFDSANPSDLFSFIIKYNDPTASIKTNSSLLSNVSEVFPNPSSSKASINITALVDFNMASISVINALGSVVLSKTIDLSIGKNTIDLDFQNLISGLYFVTISNNNSKITKKFTINK